MKALNFTNQFNQIKKATYLGITFLGLAFQTNAQEAKTTKAHFGLIYPLSTNGTHAPLDTNNLSIHLLAGISSVEKGFSYAGLSNVVRNESYGVQIAGFSNHIGKQTNGALFAGFLNTYRSAKGSQFAGFANLAQKNVEGAQFAGFINTTGGDMKGVQFAGFSNIARNISASQFAGFMNVAKDVNGSQFAGFINIAKKVKGAQVAGFINIAETSDNPIGIINIIKNGEKSIAATIDESQTSMLTFRSGGKNMYGIIGVGYNLKNKDEVYAFEAGLGAHFFKSKYFRLNMELTQTILESFEKGEYFKGTFRLLPAVKVAPWLEIFGGPSINFVSTNTVEGKALHPESDDLVIRTWNRKNSDFKQSLHIGYQAGLQFVF
ncbi:hypothetical protein [Pedobacter chitinilyticus]|uniref:Uncharacterized protein n=1 Tax=Pedobacter chitinilyticus TaxID=2233776 RepID=A0A443YP82_9SPHI|nr:hypothetical protein [Pedobacter chitinilyticus]RWU05573.1 hypothetical protein DPV69_15625 [Pedobacter chitinilyticus]